MPLCTASGRVPRAFGHCQWHHTIHLTWPADFGIPGAIWCQVVAKVFGNAQLLPPFFAWHRQSSQATHWFHVWDRPTVLDTWHAACFWHSQITVGIHSAVALSVSICQTFFSHRSLRHTPGNCFAQQTQGSWQPLAFFSKKTFRHGNALFHFWQGTSCSFFCH